MRKVFLIIISLCLCSVLYADTIHDEQFGLGYIKSHFLKLDQTVGQDITNGPVRVILDNLTGIKQRNSAGAAFKEIGIGVNTLGGYTFIQSTADDPVLGMLPLQFYMGNTPAMYISGTANLELYNHNISTTGIGTDGTHYFGSSTGVSATAAAGVLTLAGIGNVNNENLLFDFETTADSIAIKSGTGASLAFTGSGNPPYSFTRSTVITNAAVTVQELIGKSSGSAEDAFGPSYIMTLQDAETTGTAGRLARLSAVRKGADNTGALEIYTYGGGVATLRLRISDTETIFNEPSANGIIFRVEGNSDINMIYGNGPTDFVGIGDTGVAKLSVALTDATTNTVSEVMRITHSGGTVAAGFGTGLDYYLEDATAATIQQASRIGTLWVDATDATRTSAITFSGVTSGGALTEWGRISAAALALGSTPITTTGTLGAGAITGTSFIIGANTLTTSEWAFLDGQDQAVKIASSPTFATFKTLDAATGGTDSTFIGAGAGASSTINTNYCTFIGREAGNKTNWANDNTFIGYRAGYSNTGGSYNVAIGTAALFANTTGSYNFAIGQNSLYWNTGGFNVAIGRSAMEKCTTGKYHVAIGNDAGFYNQIGWYNTFIGYQAGLGVVSTSYGNNVAIGYQAGLGLTTGGDSNTLLGYQAGYSISTGENNIIIGSTIDTPAATTDNYIKIGSNLTGDNSTGTTVGSTLKLTNAVATEVGLTIQGAASQSADILQIRKSDATIYTVFDALGKLVFGPSGAQDTNLYRSAANTLTTDDNLTLPTGDLTQGTTYKHYFRDSAIYAWSSADGWMNLVADTGVEVNAPILNVSDLYIAGSVTGKIIYPPSATQPITAAVDAILANATVVVLNPDGDYALTSTPTIANGTTGQILYIITDNAEANTVTVQDEGTIPNSNLELGAAGRAIGARDVLVLMYNGAQWVEVSYANN